MKARPKHVLITGASGGLGAALAETFAAPDVTLSLTGRDAERLQRTARRCTDQGAATSVQPLDVCDRNALQSWVAARDDAHPVDLVIANAALASTLAGPQPVTEPWPVIERIVQTNLLGALATVEPLIARMCARRRGQIAFIASLGAYAGMPISPIYNASKAALKIYAEALRGRLSPYGVGVSVVLPGFIASDMSARYPGPRPYMMSAAAAAGRIKRGLERNAARIAFPWQLWLGMYLLSLLPTDWSLALQRWSGYNDRQKGG